MTYEDFNLRVCILPVSSQVLNDLAFSNPRYSIFNSRGRIVYLLRSRFKNKAKSSHLSKNNKASQPIKLFSLCYINHTITYTK